MQRRNFLATSLAAGLGLSTAAAQTSASHTSMATTTNAAPREFYLLRQYRLVNGPETALAEHFLSDALLPALTRLGLDRIGLFRLEYGPETPTVVALIPSTSAELLATLDDHLAADAAFLTAAKPFWSAPASAPAFQRAESTLLHAFTGWPRLVAPAPAANAPKRILQLRTYESPSMAAHIRKVEMFNNGEFAIFQKAGCNPVFFSSTIIGPRQPSLTYMLSFNSLADLDAGWSRFVNDPDWKKLSTDPHYSYEPIVSNITNLILSPHTASQI